MEVRLVHIRDGYNRVAKEYAEKFFHELDGKPKDRELLQRFSKLVSGKGPVCDLGCGPGEVAYYLNQIGTPEVFGIDLAPDMITLARQLNPGLEFRSNDYGALPDAENSWAGIAAFYSIVHVPRADVIHILREWKRVLKPGGMLLLSFHIGNEIIHPEEFLGQKVNIDWICFEVAEMVQYLIEAGFLVLDVIERAPYVEVEHPTNRGYIFAGKPVEEEQQLILM